MSARCETRYATNHGVSVPSWKDRQVFVTNGFLNFLTDEQKRLIHNPENIALVPVIDAEKRIAELERENADLRATVAAQSAALELAKVALEFDGHDACKCGWCEACVALAAIEALPAAPDPWLPIETAPKDGRTILLGYRNSLGKWRTVRGRYFTRATIDEEWEEPDECEEGWYETSVEADDVPNCWFVIPTHWMPLPAAPKGGAE